jgi:hypothetical protein
MLKHVEDITAIHALTRADIKKLREADTISFHRSPTQSSIDAKLRKLTQATEQIVWEHSVPVHSTLKWSSLEDNDQDGKKKLSEVAYCHVYHTGTNNIHMEWRTIASLLREDDRLELVWYRDAGSNGYMKRHGLHGDRLQIVIHRPHKTGFQHLLFLIESQCCENNSARMIRRGVYNNE